MVETGPAASEKPAIEDETRIDPRIRRTRRDLRRALQDVLHEMPYDQITIRDIAAKAEIAYTTFFRHYQGKEALLAGLADDETIRLLDACWPAMKLRDSYDSCLALCRHVQNNRLVWTALLCSGADSAVRQALIRHTLERSKDWPPAADWLPHDIGMTLIVGVIIELLTWWLRQAAPDTPERIAGILDKLLVSALVPPATSPP
jgi:AcrR family transcriptional regulator